MQLLTYKDDNKEYTYYIDKDNVEVTHGEFKGYYTSGGLRSHTFIYHGEWHGEYKTWGRSGGLCAHAFYINGKRHPYVEMNDHEKLLFQIKHPGFRFIED